MRSFGSLPIEGVKRLLDGLNILTAYQVSWTKIKQCDKRERLSCAENHLMKALEAFGLDAARIKNDESWNYQRDASAPEKIILAGGFGRDSRLIQDENFSIDCSILQQLICTVYMRHEEYDKELTEPSFVDASNFVTTQLVSLMQLWRLTKQTIDGIPCAEGHGGSRRKPAREGALIRQLINIYGELRNLFPKSGPKPAGGGPMFRFIKACALVCGFSNISDKQIEDAWRQRSKPVNPDNQREK